VTYPNGRPIERRFGGVRTPENRRFTQYGRKLQQMTHSERNTTERYNSTTSREEDRI
jgi:hypothetical protein